MKKKRKNSNSMYTGDEEVREFEFEEEAKYNKKQRIKRIIGAIILLIIVFIIVFLLMRSCFTDTTIVEVSENEKTLLKAGKEYFDKYYEKAPTEKGECARVTLNELILEGLITKTNFVNCGGNTTYVQMCMLNSGNIHYTPVLACDEIKTDFENWQSGSEKNLVKDQSDIKFKFKGYYLANAESEENLGEVEEVWESDLPTSGYKKVGSTTYYRSREKLYVWNLNKKTYYPGNAYYKSSPASGYYYKDSKTTGYKWYKIIKNETYTYSEYKWVEDSKPRKTSPYPVYVCYKNGSTNVVYSTKACSTRSDGYTVYKNETYNACNSVVKTNQSYCLKCDSGSLKSDKTSCGHYEWKTVDSCNASDSCKKNVIVNETRKYYPSGSSKASGEKAYYKSSPASGYTNKSDKATVYKWYKLTKTGTTSVATNTQPEANATRTNKYTYGKWSEWTTKKISGSTYKQVQKKDKIKIRRYNNVSDNNWVELTNGYVTEDELIKAFKEKKFEVNSLKDINNNGKLKYTAKLYYRNRIGGK